MTYEFLIEVDKKIYEISDLVTKVTYKDTLNDGCSKLEFSFVDDGLKLQNGSIVRFKYNGANIFYGYVFRYETNKKKDISVTAYDQLRYCKAKDIIVVKGDTITTLVKRMCTYFGLKTGTLTNSSHILATSVQDDKTWLDIIYNASSDTLMNTGKKYCLRDEFGNIALRDLEELKLDLILGDQSLCYDFNFKKSIDDDFYNQIKIYIKGDEKNKAGIMTGTKDEASIKKYGLLQYYESVDSKTNYSQALNKAKILLTLYNHEAETLSLDCLGDTDIRAGSSFYAQISDISLNKRLIVKEVTHEFLPAHTMSLEVTT